MATLFKRGKNWHIAYYEEGKRIYRSLKTADAKIARRLKKELEGQLANGSHKREKRITVADYFKMYQEETRYRKRSTNVADQSRIREFLRHNGKRVLNSINYDDIRAYLNTYEKHSPKTYNHIIGTLRRFFRLATEREFLLKNPVASFRRKKEPQNPPRFLTDEEYMILERLSESEGIFSMIVTARYTGLRLSELLHLEWQDYDWDRKLVRVLNKPKYNHTVKNYQTRVIPISNEFREKLLPYIRAEGLCFPTPSGKPYNHEGPRRALRKIVAKSALREGRRMGWHDLRHTFASRLAQQGAPIFKISKWLGHKDIRTTMIYSHYSPAYDEEIEKLSILFPVETG